MNAGILVPPPCPSLLTSTVSFSIRLLLVLLPFNLGPLFLPAEGKITRRESLEFEWLTTDPHDRPEPPTRREMVGETSDYFSDYSAGTGVNNRPSTGKSTASNL